MDDRERDARTAVEGVAEFDLEKALAAWSSGFTQLTGDELQELVEHMREEFAGLLTLGLSSEEAWLIATRRLGDREHLDDEFSKLHGRRRVFTFLFGYFVVALALSTVTAVALRTYWLAAGLGTPIAVTLGALCLFVPGVIFVRVLPKLALWLPDVAIRSPMKTALVFFIYFAGSIGMNMLQKDFYDDLLRDQDKLSVFVWVQSSFSIATTFFLPAYMLWTAIRHRKERTIERLRGARMSWIR